MKSPDASDYLESTLVPEGGAYPGVGDICSCPSLKGRLGTPYNVTVLPDTGHYAIYIRIVYPVKDPSYEVYIRVVGVEPRVGEKT